MMIPIVKLVLAFCAWSALLAACSRSDGTVRSFGPIRVGQELPSYGGSSAQSGRTIGPTTPPGRFYVHVIDDTLPPTCLDEECGPEGAAVAALGGHVIGASDGKLAGAFGVRLVSPAPWRFDTSLLVVSDDRARVLAIWPGRRLSDAVPAAKRAGY